MEKFHNRYGISSKLQEDILRYICRNANGTYDIIAAYCNRNVRTIGQSVRTLEDNYYLEKQPIKEGKKRSKYLIVPTFKGVQYGVAFLDLDYSEYVKAYNNKDETHPYFEYSQKVRDYSKMCEYLKYFARLHFEHNLFNQGVLIVTNFADAFSKGVKSGLADIGQTTSNSSGADFADRGIEIAQDILPPRQLYDFKNYLDESMQRFSKEMAEKIKKLDS